MNHSVAVLTLAAAISIGTPMALAALGEILTQRSGVMNLGIEGMMLMGAVMGVVGTSWSGNPWLGLGFGACAGALFALVHAALAISLRVNQVVSGLALVLLGTGLSSYIGRVPSPPLPDRAAVASIGPLFPHALRSLPVVGPIVLGQDLVVYLSILLTALASRYLFHTRLGLELRAVGEDPATADAAGVRVVLVRYLHTVLGGALSGIGGAYFTIVITGTWQPGVTAGAGWIAFALVYFAHWRPWRSLVAAYLFGALTNLKFTLEVVGVNVPGEFLSMLPFAMTVLVLIAVSARPSAARLLGAPAALGDPYLRESR